MAENQLLRYPRGQMKMGGDLVQVSEASFSMNTNVRLVHTLRKSPSGVVIGNKECSFSFTAQIDEDGLERDWILLNFKGTVKTFQFILPAATALVALGVVGSCEVAMPSGEPVTLRGGGVAAFVE